MKFLNPIQMFVEEMEFVLLKMCASVRPIQKMVSGVDPIVRHVKPITVEMDVKVIGALNPITICLPSLPWLAFRYLDGC